MRAVIIDHIVDQVFLGLGLGLGPFEFLCGFDNGFAVASRPRNSDALFGQPSLVLQQRPQQPVIVGTVGAKMDSQLHQVGLHSKTFQHYKRNSGQWKRFWLSQVNG